MSDFIYGVTVKFKNRDGWSKEYTYAHNEFVEPDTLVVVPNNNGFFDVARVKRCVYDYEFQPGIGYKKIVEVLSRKFSDLK